MTPNEFANRCIRCLADGGHAVDIVRLTRQASIWQRENRDVWGKNELLHCSDDLMIVDLTLPPFATSPVHEHKTWAVIGISEGCEIDELFEERGARLGWSARHELRAGDVLELGPDCIHFIGNPSATARRGIHVYGRNLARRSGACGTLRPARPRPWISRCSKSGNGFSRRGARPMLRSSLLPSIQR